MSKAQGLAIDHISRRSRTNVLSIDMMLNAYIFSTLSLNVMYGGTASHCGKLPRKKKTLQGLVGGHILQ